MFARQQQLLCSEDSLTVLLDKARALLPSNGDQDKELTDRIVGLETELFGVQSPLSEIDNKMTAIENEWSANNITADAHTPATVGWGAEESVIDKGSDNVPSLIKNSFFVSNLSVDDYASLTKAQGYERSVENYMKIFRVQYFKQIEQDTLYRAAKSVEEGTPYYNEFARHYKLNSSISDTIAKQWNYLSDTKSYLYSYLLDKFDRKEMIEDFEQKSMQLRIEEQNMGAGYADPNVAYYPLRHSMVLYYEIKLADWLCKSKAKDSLAARFVAVDLSEYLLPNTYAELRPDVDYTDVKIVQGKYTTANPIPEIETPDRGTVYRIKVGSFSRPQPITTLRNGYPMVCDKSEAGKYVYYVGLFPTAGSTARSLETLRKAGFKTPEVVKWVDGERVVESEPQVGTATASSSKSTSSLYRIEITGAGSGLSDQLKSTVRSEAPNKELSRFPIDGGQFKFIVGSFKTKAEAEALVTKLRSADSGITVTIVELGR